MGRKISNFQWQGPFGPDFCRLTRRVANKPGKNPKALFQLASLAIIQCNAHEAVDSGAEFLAGLAMGADIFVDCRNRSAIAGFWIAPGK